MGQIRVHRILGVTWLLTSWEGDACSVIKVSHKYDLQGGQSMAEGGKYPPHPPKTSPVYAQGFPQGLTVERYPTCINIHKFVNYICDHNHVYSIHKLFSNLHIVISMILYCCPFMH